MQPKTRGYENGVEAMELLGRFDAYEINTVMSQP
jgi:hypothetical protein